MANGSFNVTYFCAKDDQETSRVCLTESWAPSCCYPPYPSYFAVIMGTYWLIMGIVGGFGNLMVLIALPYARRKCTDPRSPLKSSTTVLLLSLSLSDCLICFIVIGPSAIVTFIGKWCLGYKFCYFFAFNYHLLGLASPYSMAAATINRAMKLWCPAATDKIFEPYSSLPVVLGVWILSSLVPILAAVHDDIGYSRIQGGCVIITANLPISSTLFGIAMCLPLIAVLVCLVLIWIRLNKNWSELKQFKGISQTTLQELKRREKRMANLLMLLAATYFTSIAPIFAFYAFSEGGPWVQPNIYFTFLTVDYFAVNVFLYFYRIKSYRDAMALFYKDMSCTK